LGSALYGYPSEATGRTLVTDAVMLSRCNLLLS
jgi:hypothetical protein